MLVLLPLPLLLFWWWLLPLLPEAAAAAADVDGVDLRDILNKHSILYSDVVQLPSRTRFVRLSGKLEERNEAARAPDPAFRIESTKGTCARSNERLIPRRAHAHPRL